MSVSVLTTARRLIAATAVAAAVVGAAAPPAAAAGHRSGRSHGVVYISDVRHDGGGRGARSDVALNQQWAAVTSESRRAVTDRLDAVGRGRAHLRLPPLLPRRATVRVPHRRRPRHRTTTHPRRTGGHRHCSRSRPAEANGAGGARRGVARSA
ncbi:hypothetical protein ACF09H_15895 [Streptomyces sp. NPDC014983]|uniref:hypothetical protein n=1 Tax=Streptomyces sp. NPDC014983 TaxID=3364933 RepID=UPI0036F6C1F8